MDLRKNLTPALLAYDGIQYTYMAPAVFEDSQYDYVQEHLRILSGFYGVVKPMIIQEDGIMPAYHMNKMHWITVRLDGTVPEERVFDLIGMSFMATASAKKKVFLIVYPIIEYIKIFETREFPGNSVNISSLLWILCIVPRF